MSKEIQVIDENEVIATHNDLLYKARWPRLSIYAQRLIVTVTSLVKEDDDDFMDYIIRVQELCRFLGTNNHDIYKRLDEATDELMQKLIKWETPVTEDLEKVSWCSYAKLAKKKGYVKIRFDKALKPFFIALKNHFTQYELRAVLRLKNHYFLRLYQLIKYHQGISNWLAKKRGPKNHYTSKEFEIGWLKNFLDIEEGQYTRYCHLEQRILNPAKKDIKEKTDVLFKFKPRKEGRKIKYVTISWYYNQKYNQKELPFTEPPKENGYVNSDTFLRVQDFGLSKTEAKRVYTLHRQEAESDEDFNKGLNEKLDELESRKEIVNMAPYAKETLLNPAKSIFKAKIQREKEEVKEKQAARAKKKEEATKQLKRYEKLHGEYKLKRLREILKEKRGVESEFEDGELIKKFENTLNEHQISTYKKLGIRHRAFHFPYRVFLYKKFLPPDDLDLQVFIRNNQKKQ